MNSNNHDDDLLMEALDGRLSEEELRGLADRLKQDPELARRMIELARDESLLQEILLESKADISVAGRRAGRQEERRARSAGRQARPIRWGRWISVAACLAIIVGSLVYNARQEKRFVEALVAHIQQTEPNVKVIRGADGRVVAAIVGMDLFAGDRIEAKKGEQVVFGYQGEETIVTVGDGAGESKLTIGDVEKGKRLRLEKGMIDASVAPQPVGRGMVIETPHAKARVKGTRFRLAVVSAGPGRAVQAGFATTQIDVIEGAVEFTRVFDDSSVLVSGGERAATRGAYTPAAKGVDAARWPGKLIDGAVICSDDFESGLEKWESKLSAARVIRNGVARMGELEVLTGPDVRRVTIEGRRLKAKRSNAVVLDAVGLDEGALIFEIEGLGDLLQKRGARAFSMEFDRFVDGSAALSHVWTKTSIPQRVLFWAAPAPASGTERVRVEVVAYTSISGACLDVKQFEDGRLVKHVVQFCDEGPWGAGCVVRFGGVAMDNVVVKEMVPVENR